MSVLEDRAVETPSSTPPSTPPTRSRRVLEDRALVGVVGAAALSLLAVGGAFAGLGSLMDLAFPALALAFGLRLLLTKRFYAYLAFVLVLWPSAPEVRRVVDWQSTYHAFSLVNGTPALVTLIALPWVLAHRRRLHKDVAWLFAIASCVMAYATAVGVVRNGLGPTVADCVLIVAPLVLGLFVLTVPEDDARLRALVGQFALWGALLIGGYAIVQFLVLPPWDEAWMIDSNVGNLGEPVAREFRAFGPLGTASYLAQTLAAMVLVLVAERRTGWQLVAVAAGLGGLALSLSRGGWLALVVGLVVLALLGRLRIWRLVAGVVALGFVLAATGSPIYERVSDRVEETRTEGTSDTSLVERLQFQTEIAPHALADVDGSGMGATGRAAMVSGDPGFLNQRFASFDSGIFESLVRYGSVAGLALLGGLVVVAVRIVRRARRGTLFDAACGAAICGLTVGMLFQDMQRGIFGVMLWLLLAVAGRYVEPARDGNRAQERAIPS